MILGQRGGGFCLVFEPLGRPADKKPAILGQICKKLANYASQGSKSVQKCALSIERLQRKPNRHNDPLEDSVNRRELILAISEESEVDRKTVDAVVASLVDVITEQVAKGEKISIPGFAKFARVDRAARMGRNPATGEPVKIKASRKARITPLKAFKDAVLTGKVAKKAKPIKKVAAKKAPATKTAAKKAPATKAAAKKAPAKKVAKKTTAKRK
jgi:DNA-binding protein HU-beta